MHSSLVATIKVKSSTAYNDNIYEQSWIKNISMSMVGCVGLLDGLQEEVQVY